ASLRPARARSPNGLQCLGRLRHLPRSGRGSGHCEASWSFLILRSAVSVRVVIHGPAREPLPERAKILADPRSEELPDVRCLSFEVAPQLKVGLQPASHLGVVLNPAKALGGHCPDYVHPPRNHRPSGPEAIEYRSTRESVFGQTDHLIVEIGPGVILWLHVHRLVVVQEVEWEWQDAIRALQLQIERCRSPKCREQRIAG